MGVGPHVVLRMAVAVAAGIIRTRVTRADREYKPGGRADYAHVKVNEEWQKYFTAKGMAGGQAE